MPTPPSPTGTPRVTPSCLAAALDYATKGLRVLPLYSSDSARGCSCTKGKACQSSGKHPRTMHGLRDATTDPAKIRKWWSKWPEANVGIVTGAESGIIVLDVDPRHGGDDSLAALERAHGEIPETATSLTGGGGTHYLFKHPGGHLGNSAGQLGPGLDVRGDGGYIVAPPSLHASGRRYTWDKGRTGIAGLPMWLLALIRDSGGNGQAAQPSPGAGETTIPEGRRHDTLLSLAGTMRRASMSSEEILAGLLAVNARRCAPPLPEAEVRSIAVSVERYAPAPATATDPSTIPDVPPMTPWPTPAPEVYHGLAGKIVRAIEPHSEADPIALLVQLLVAFGNLIGRAPHCIADGARHGLNLFACLVGATAKGRKGTSWGRVKSLFERIDPTWAKDRVRSGLVSGEGVIHNVRDAEEATGKGKEGDPGEQDKRLLAYEGEFAGVLRVMAREGCTVSAVLRSAWDDWTLSTLAKNSPLTATGAHVSIVAHCTIPELLRYLDRTEQGNGFGNRFLWVCVRRSKALAEGGEAWPSPLDALLPCLRQAVDFARTHGVIERTPDARALWAQVYGPLSDGRPGLLGAMTARAEAQVLRLAALYALFDVVPDVRVPHLEAATALWRYCEGSARYVFGDSLGDPVADRALDALRQAPEGLDTTALHRRLGGNTPGKRLAEALSLLEGQGLARREREVSGGRPREVWYARGSGPEVNEESEVSPLA